MRTLRSTNPGEGLFISQIDVTRGHFNDIAAMADLKQRVSAKRRQQGVPTSDVHRGRISA